eukprot:177337-Rhodomonas_salina.1
MIFTSFFNAAMIARSSAKHVTEVQKEAEQAGTEAAPLRCAPHDLNPGSVSKWCSYRDPCSLMCAPE